MFSLRQYSSTLASPTPARLRITLSYRLHSQGKVIKPEGSWLSYQEAEVTSLDCFHHGAGRPGRDISNDYTVAVTTHFYFPDNRRRHRFTHGQYAMNKPQAV